MSIGSDILAAVAVPGALALWAWLEWALHRETRAHPLRVRRGRGGDR